MRALLAVTAAILTAVVLPAPASADGSHNRSFTGIPNPSVEAQFGRDNRFDRQRRGGDIFLGDWEYRGDTAWRSEGFNDWWHSQPERAFPRWMQNNVGCQRKWWGGDQLRC